MLSRLMLCLAWAGIFASVAQGYKLAELPLNAFGPNKSEAEQNISDLLTETIVHDIKDLGDLPNVGDEAKSEGEDKDEGPGGLGKSLEFLMLKVAQLETLAELQQTEIGIQAEKIEKLEKHLGMEPSDSGASMAQKTSEKSMQLVQATLKRVVEKHARQRDTRQYHPAAHRQQPEAEGEVESEESEELEEDPGREGPAMLQSRAKGFPGVFKKAWDETGGKAVDGLKSTAGKLREGYEHAKKAGNMVKYWAENAIDTVELAIEFLKQGFGDWRAWCPSTFDPGFSRSGSQLTFTIGRQWCRVSLMGKDIDLFDIDLGSVNINLDIMNMLPTVIRTPLNTMINLGKGLVSCANSGSASGLFPCLGNQIIETVPPLKAMVNLGKGLVGCVDSDSPGGLVTCLGSQIIATVPPLNYLTKMGDILTEIIEFFAKVASTVVQKAMEHGPSLVQTAATAKFPGANEPPILHHKSTNLAIEVHTGHAPPGSYLHRELAAVQTNATHATRDGQTGGDDPDGAITYNIGSGGDVHATQLFTQFDGRETDTSSCLAFAPKNRRGQGISKFDWQVYNKDDFLQLEPWAVPCDNAWMKDNVNKWQGYSFYFGQKAVEKCVTVTFSMGMQPVVAFVGGLQFEVLPKPLFELATTVCWPNKQPGGVDLSVLRSEIKSAGILLFSRTLRLSKRFGHNTDFSSGNIKDSYETWKSPAGIAKGESRAPMDTLRRTSFLQGNQTHQSQENEATETAKAKAEMAEEGLQWKAETEDLYLASVDYGEHMNTSVEKTFEAYGEEAARRMGASSGSDDFKFFRFKSPGMVSFEIEGLMSGNTLQLGMEMGFGPYQSPPKMIPLVDIGAQFALILAGLPFVSARSKLTAIEALKDFSMKDMGRAHGLPVRPDSVVALYNPHSGRYLKMSTNKLEPSPPMEKWGIPDSWGLERFTVVDAKKGQIALHSSAHNRFVGTGTVSPSRNVNDLPGDWASERFTVRDEGHGEVTLYNKHHSKCLKLWASGVGSSSTCGESSRFVLVPAERILTPGTMIALHSLKDNRFLKIDGERLTHSPTKDAVDLPSDWVSERFSVVDAGHGRIALHNAVHNRFVGRNKASPHRLPDQLPGDWHSEQFDVFPAGNGEITLRNRANWNTERLRVVHVKPYLEPGSTVALWCKAHGRYVKMGSGNPSSFLLARENHTGNETWPTPMLNRFRNALKTASRQMKHAGEQVVAKISGGRIFRSPERGSSGIPDDWVSERFTVVDAGNGQVAFHNSKYNRFLKMTHDGKMQVSPHLNVDALPSNWASERYTVVPAGGGQFAFHNSAHNRIIRMSGSEVDASPHRSPQDLPATWLWERFQVVPVKPYAPPGAIVALRCDRHGSYLAMTGTSLSRSSRTGADAIFTVVAAGNGQVAFHNSRHKRFVKMNGATMEVSPVRAADDLPASWTWERFTVIPAGLGEFALHNSAHNRIGTTEPPTHLEL